MPNTDHSSNSLMSRCLTWTLVALVFILPFDEGGNGYMIQAVTQLLLLACALMWGVESIRARQFRLRYTGLDVIILAGLAWIGVSLVFSAYRYATILEAIKVLAYVTLWCVSRRILSGQATRTLILGAMVGSGCVQFGVALYNRGIRQTPTWQSGFVNPNEFACLLVIGAHLALSFLLFRAQQPTQSARFRRALPVCAALTVVLAVVMLLVLQSRGALLSIAVGVFMLATLRHRLAGLAFVIMLAISLFLPLPHGSLMQRLSKSDDPFAYQRLDIWQSSLRMLRDHPIVGVGLGMFPYYGAAYNFPVEHQIARYGKRLDLAHNDLLQIGAESGLVGLLLAVGGIVCLGRLSIRNLRIRPISWHVAASSAGLLGVFANGLVSNLLPSPALAMMSVLLAAVLLESTATFRSKTWTIPERTGAIASWYGALAVGGIYILVPVIGYPFLAHHHFLRYQHYRRAGQLGDAVEHLRKAIRSVPMQAYYHQAFGQLYTAAFRNQPNLDAYYEAYTSLTEAIRQNPREARFYMTLADLHRTMFQELLPNRPAAENVLQEYARALEVDPFSPFMRAEMATFYADIGEFEHAIATIRQAVTDEPHFVRGHQLLGEFLRQTGQETAATEAFANAEKIVHAYPLHASYPEYTQELLKALYE